MGNVCIRPHGGAKKQDKNVEKAKFTDSTKDG